MRNGDKRSKKNTKRGKKSNLPEFALSAAIAIFLFIAGDKAEGLISEWLDWVGWWMIAFVLIVITNWIDELTE